MATLARFALTVPLLLATGLIACSTATTKPAGAVGDSGALEDAARDAASDGDSVDAAHAVCGAVITPDVAPSKCSIRGANSAKFTVESTCDGMTLEVLWVGYDCEEVSYGTVSKGGPKFQSESFVTHPWRLRDATTHALLMEIPALKGPTDIVYP